MIFSFKKDFKEFQCKDMKGEHSIWMEDMGVGMNGVCLHGAEFSLTS